MNSHELHLTEGDYKYYLRCIDLAGNIATSMVNFSVKIDSLIPGIVRVYKEDNQLKVINLEKVEDFQAQ